MTLVMWFFCLLFSFGKAKVEFKKAIIFFRKYVFFVIRSLAKEINGNVFLKKKNHLVSVVSLS